MPTVTFYLNQKAAGAAVLRIVPFELKEYFYCHPKGLEVYPAEAKQIIETLATGGHDGTVAGGRYRWRREEPPPDFAIKYVFPYTLEETLWLLNQHHQRATYRAVGDILGIIARAVMHDRERNYFNSWVVAEDTELPTDYADGQMHPNLLDNTHVFHVHDELLRWLDERRQLDYPLPVLQNQ